MTGNAAGGNVSDAGGTTGGTAAGTVQVAGSGTAAGTVQVAGSGTAAGTTAASGVVQQEGVREEVQTGVPTDVPTEPALPALTSDRAYVTMLTKDGNGYEVFVPRTCLRQTARI